MTAPGPAAAYRAMLAAGGALAAEGALRLLQRCPPGGAARWQRRNHRGEPVTLLAGPALATAVAAGAAAGTRAPLRATAAVTAAVCGAVGMYDDLAGAAVAQSGDKGFRGHLRALRQGRVSAGLVKLVVVGTAGLVAGSRIGRSPVDRVVAGGVVAGTANLLNLLDLRPGRALKAALLTGAPLLRGPYADLLIGPLGAAGALLRHDLGERVMIGDAGANALGAVLGVRLAAGSGPRGRAVALAVLAGLTAVSERVSFTRVIAATPVLREIDAWGRRPAAVPPG